MSKKFIKSFAAFLLVLCMMLTNFGGWNLSLAEDTPENNQVEQKEQLEADELKDEPDKDKENPAQDNVEEDETKPLEQDTKEADNDGFEMSEEVKPESVGAAVEQLPKPTITTPIKSGDQEIKGMNGVRGKKRKKEKSPSSVITVIVKDNSGGLVETAKSGKPTNMGAWKAKLTKPLKKGYTVTAYQEYNENDPDFKPEYANKKSNETDPVTVIPSIADYYLNDQEEPTISMPDYELWVIDKFTISEKEKKEVADKFKEHNKDVKRNDNSTNTFSKDCRAVSYDKDKIKVTFRDGSIIDDIPANNITINQITEKSQVPNIEKTYVADGSITITLDSEVQVGTKIGLVKQIASEEKNNFCDNGSCKSEKFSPTWVTVDSPTNTFTYKVDDNFLQLGQEFGVIVQEYRKLPRCKKTEPVIKIPNVPVKDPKKLTDKEKEEIRKAIRKANTTTSGKSKMPDGTGFISEPAFIEISDDGKVKIISPNDVETDWDNKGNPIYSKNSDGTYKLDTGKENNFIKIEAKELLKNLAPEKPEVKQDKGNVIITPNPADTDVKKVEVTYKGTDGKEKTVTATKDDQDGTWTTNDPEVKVDDKGVVTLPTSKVKGNSTVSAKVTDDGGIAQDDTEKKGSDAGEITITASVQTPSVTVDPKTGDVTVTPKDNDTDAKRLFITYTPANGTEKEKTVIAKKDINGKWSITGESDFVASADGKSFTIKNAKAKEKSKVKAITKGEKDDLVSGTAEATVPDKTAPQAPEVKVNVSNGSAEITPPTDADTKTVTVKYPDPSGNEKTAIATKDNDGWKITEGAADGVTFDSANGFIKIPYDKMKKADTVSATATDEAGNPSPSNTDTTLPPVPTVKVTENKDITVTPPTTEAPAVDGMEIKYTPSTDGASEMTLLIKKTDGIWKIEGDTPEGVSINKDSGVVTIKKGTAKDLSDVTAKSKIDENKIGLETAEKQVPDTTAPKAPEVKINTNDGSAQITPPSDADTKTVTVTYKDQDGADKTATATKGNNGWEITQGGDDGVTFDSASGFIKIPYEKMKKADTVSATAKDDSGNESKSKTDTTLPPVPSVDLTKEKDITVTPPADAPAVNGMDVTYTPAKESKAKTIKIVKGNDDKWKLEGDPIKGISVDENSGVVTFVKGTAKDDTNVSALSKIGEDKKGLETATAKVPDTTAPEKPEVKVQDDGSVTITPKKDSDTKTVTVTYKDENGKDKTATATKGDNGEWTVTGDNGETIDKTTGVITIPKGKSNPGDKVIAKAKDAADNESGPSDDTTNPAPPTVTPDQESGNVTITPPDKGKLDGMDIEYKTPDGTKRNVRAKKENNKWTIEGDNPDGVKVDEDTGKVTIPKGKAKEKTEVIANSTLGELKTPAENTPTKPNTVPDKTAPNPPTVAVDTKTGNVTITPPTDKDTTSVTVTYKKADNTEIKVKAKKAGKKWSLTKEDGTSQVDNGETVDKDTGVITIPKENYKPGEELSAYGNDNVDNKSTEDQAKPVEVTFEANGGSKTMPSEILALNKNAQATQGQSFYLAAQFKLPLCSFKAPAGKQFAGWSVNGQIKQAKDTIKVDANTIVTATWEAIPQPERPYRPEKPYRPYPSRPTAPSKDNKTDKKPDTKVTELEKGTHYRYLYGYPDGTVRPEGLITRAEAAALIARLANLDMSDASKPNFKDVPSKWYNSAINAVVKKNLMFANKDGKFRPNEAITRGEFARALFYIDKVNDAVAPFADVKGHEFEKAINQAYGNDRISGYPDGTFKPNAFIKRAEAAKILNHYAKRGVDHDGIEGVRKYLAYFKDLNETYWGYYEIMEAANSHEYERNINTRIETWIKILNK